MIMHYVMFTVQFKFVIIEPYVVPYTVDPLHIYTAVVYLLIPLWLWEENNFGHTYMTFFAQW